MKTLHLIKTSVGASWALRQTTELVKLGLEVHIALPPGPMVEKYQQAGVTTHVFDPALDVKRPWRNISNALRLRKLVKTLSPDFVHSHFVATTLLMRFALIGLSTTRIFHVPGPLHLEHSIFRRLDLWTGGKHDYWLASCLWTKNKYLSCGIPQNRVGLAYYGVNESDFHFSADIEGTLRQDLNIDTSTFLIGMVAYFYAPKPYLGQTRGLKGHEDLIDAMALVAKQQQDIKCVFVGGPWGNTQAYYTQVQQYAQQHAPGLCVFLGMRKDVPKLYPQFDLAVHPSHSENVGGAVESMYAGVATLTSDVGGFPDLVKDGETGYMAPSKNPQMLAEKILEAIADPNERARRIANASVKVAEVMNVEHNAKQVLAFYQQISQSKLKEAVHG